MNKKIGKRKTRKNKNEKTQWATDDDDTYAMGKLDEIKEYKMGRGKQQRAAGRMPEADRQPEMKTKVEMLLDISEIHTRAQRYTRI